MNDCDYTVQTLDTLLLRLSITDNSFFSYADLRRWKNHLDLWMRVNAESL